MKRIEIQNEFTQWAEYLARYFGHDLLIYDTEGRLMWGSPARLQLTQKELYNTPSIYPIYKDIAEPIAYYDGSMLTPSEYQMLKTIIPFIENQLEDEGA
jgi:hypothetical protein